mmetsp:Transcript_53592/g.86755  ORF Transcript_53592/g.86755 Transcript_53592/m.86755 type:complete len:529 (+) Transcript_53592:272-1858(+)
MLLEMVTLRKNEGRTLRILQLMDNVTSLEPVHDRTEVGAAVVQALLQSGRAALACQAVRLAEDEGYAQAPKLLVSVAKAVSIERPRAAPAKKSGRVRGQKAAAARVVVGNQADEVEEASIDGVGKCLEIVQILKARGEEQHLDSITRVYAAVVVGLLREGKLKKAKESLAVFKTLSQSLSLGMYKSIMREFARVQSLQGVLEVLEVMRHWKITADAEALELVANVAVHDVQFVKGAVSMETLPEPISGFEVPEACFAGRSNVGKSSLVNMICNRKKLAFTSKTPGKTQEFNYFLVSGGRAVGGPSEKNNFHLVDLPGVGYAEVPTFKREEWKQFYRAYLSERPSLRVLFQLIDGRHGAMKDDLELMSLVTEVRKSREQAGEEGEGGGGSGGGAGNRRRERALEPFAHVIVLTKMDKRESKDVANMLKSVRETLKSAGCDDTERTPILLTSATSKLGRDEMWRYLRLAAGMGAEEDVVDVSHSSGSKSAVERDNAKSRKKYGKPKFKGMQGLLKKIDGKKTKIAGDGKK